MHSPFQVAKLRTSLFADEEDDSKAVGMIKEKYNATYFPKKTVDIPNEANFNKAEDKPKAKKSGLKMLFYKIFA